MRFQHALKPVPKTTVELQAMLRGLDRKQQPLILTEDGKPRAVLVDVASYSILREIALLMDAFRHGRDRAAAPAAGRASRRR